MGFSFSNPLNRSYKLLKVSKSNPYYISKHRYLELSHFCLQYKEFEKRYQDLEAMIKSGCKTEEIQGRDYIDSLSHAVRFLQEPEVDNSYKCFSEMFEKGSLLFPLYQKMKRMSA